jgi:hypothetical protein
MSSRTKDLLAFATRHIGHCSLCTRKAFLSAGGFGLAFLTLKTFDQDSLVSDILLYMTWGSLFLWGLHLVVFSIKVNHVISCGDGHVLNAGRRRAVPRFATVFGLAAAASIAPGFARAALTPASDGWKRIGSAVDAEPLRLADGGCQPVSYGCNSCCNSGISGNYFIRSDCSTGCAGGCGSEQCH